MPELVKEYTEKAQTALMKAREIHSKYGDSQKEWGEDDAKNFKGLLDESASWKDKADNELRLQKLNSWLEDPASNPLHEEGEGKGLDRGAPDSVGASRPFKSLGEQCKSVIDAAKRPSQADPRLTQVSKAPTGQGEAVASDGGFLLQEDYSSEIVRRVVKTGELIGKARRMEVGPGSNSMTWRGVEDKTRAMGSQFGGAVGYWTEEAEAATGSTLKTKRVRVELEKLTALVYITDEAMEDVVMLGSLVREAIPDVLRFMVESAMFRGSGTGQPLGVLKAGSLVTVDKETGQDPTSIVAQNVEKMFARQFAGSLMGSEWNVNQDTWPQIFDLHHVIGTGGSPMYLPPGSLQDAPFGRLLGRPIVPIEHASTLGTVGDITLNAWAAYVLVTKGLINMATSMHVKFVESEMALRFVWRINGRPLQDSALTPAQGSDTQSEFVALATRA